MGQVSGSKYTGEPNEGNFRNSQNANDMNQSISSKANGEVYLGDSSGDDTRTLLNALSTGLTVRLQKNTTYLIDPVVINNTKVKIIGDNSVLKCASTAGYFIYFDSAVTELVLEGVTIDCDNKNPKAIWLNSCSNVELLNCKFINCYNETEDLTVAGIYIRKVTDCVIRDCLIQSMVAVADTVIGNAKGTSRGIEISAFTGTISKNIVIENNRFEDITGEDADAIVVDYGSATDKTDETGIKIINNSFSNCHKRFVKLLSPRGVTIINNQMINDYATGMFSAIGLLTCSKVTVINNEIGGVLFESIMQLTGTCSEIVINSNVIKPSVEPTDSLISVNTTDLDNLIITNNVLHNGVYGIRVKTNANKLNIIGNDIECSSIPVYLDNFGYDSFSNFVITNNELHGGTYGVRVAAGATMTIKNNNISSSSVKVSVSDGLIDIDTDFNYREKVRFFEDFLGTISSSWNLHSGSDAEALDPAFNAAPTGGEVVLTTGDSTGSMAADGSQLTHKLPVRASLGNLIFETRVKINTAITNVSVNVGLIDTTLFEEAFSIGGSDVITSAASHAACFVYDDGADTKQWFACAVAGDTDDTDSGATGVAPVAGTWQTLRIEVSDDGATIYFFIDDVLVKTLNGGGVTSTQNLFATVSACGDGTAVKTVDTNFVVIEHNR